MSPGPRRLGWSCLAHWTIHLMQEPWNSDLCHRSNISCISYLWIYTSLHFSTVNKINNRHQKPGSMTGTFIGCRTRTKLKVERVNKSVDRASGTCIGNCCAPCFTVIIISGGGQKESTSSRENEALAVMWDQPRTGIWHGQQPGGKMGKRWRTSGTFGYESYISYVHLMNLESLGLV